MITYFYRVSMRPLALTDRSIGLNRVCFFDRVAHGTRSTRVTELYRVFTEFFLSRVAFDRFFRLACVGLVIFVGFFSVTEFIFCPFWFSAVSPCRRPRRRRHPETRTARADWPPVSSLLTNRVAPSLRGRPSVENPSAGSMSTAFQTDPLRSVLLTKKQEWFDYKDIDFYGRPWPGVRSVGNERNSNERVVFFFEKKRQLGRSIFRSGFDSEVPLLCVFLLLLCVVFRFSFFFYLSGAESQARTKSSCRRFWMRPCGRRWRACRLPTTASRTRSDSVRNRSDPIKLGKARKKRCNFTMSRSLKVLPRDHVDVSTR